MKILRQIYYILLILSSVSCGASTGRDIAAETVSHSSKAERALSENAENIDLINTVYKKLVFAIDSDIEQNTPPDAYFTDNALRKLQDDYDYDCDEGPCYAYFALRTSAQDSNPESDGASHILGIEPAEDGWYVVSYSDMGWYGKTRISIIDGKIDNYQPLTP